jgi:hypothetical protein
MRGVIRTRDIFVHGPTILRTFGPRVFLRSLFALARSKPCTFLDVLFATEAARAAAQESAHL